MGRTVVLREDGRRSGGVGSSILPGGSATAVLD